MQFINQTKANRFGRRPLFFSVGALAVLGGISPLLATTTSQSTPSVDPEPNYITHPLVTDIDGKGECSLEVSSAGLRGDVSYAFSDDFVAVQWRYEVPGFTEGMFLFDPSMHSTIQYYRTSFKPTEVACIGEDTLLVAGVTNAGFTIVEEWQFENVAIPSVTFTGGGEQVPPEIYVDTTSRRLVYSVPFQGSNYLGAIFRNWGDETKPFLLNTGTEEVLELDLTTLVATTVASSDGTGGLSIPLLESINGDSHFNVIGSGALAQSSAGAYWLGSNQDGGLPTLVLWDDDFDGSIDRYEALDYAGWSSSALSSASAFSKLR